VPDAIDPGRIGGPQVIPNCFMVKLEWLLPDSRKAFNVMHAQVAGGFTISVAVLNTLFGTMTSGAAWTAFAAFLHTGTSLVAVHTVDMRTPSNPDVQSSSAAVPGTGAGVPMAPQTALVVTLRTAFAGPGFRGRIYIPGWSSGAQQANQTASAAAQTALLNWANSNLFTGLNTAGLVPALGHAARAAYTGETGTAHPARAASTVPITALLVRNGNWDTQRRRGGRT
jgi:hypothetical protein